MLQKYCGHFTGSDKNPPQLIADKVKVHRHCTYYKAYCDSGLITASFDHAHGGQQLPETVYAAADFIIGNAHNGFEMFTGLVHGATQLLVKFASPFIIEEYVPGLLDGSCTATMCLTESGAGSSLSDIITEASVQQDGTYRIKGQKIFISAGDHDITENIVHLVWQEQKTHRKASKAFHFL